MDFQHNGFPSEALRISRSESDHGSVAAQEILPLWGKSLFGEILASSMGAAAKRISIIMDFGASATRISRSQSDNTL